MSKKPFLHILQDDDLTQEKLYYLLALAQKMKANPQTYGDSLQGKSVVTLFEKPSLRTHVSFDIGINKLGGHALYLGQQNGKLGERERIQDVAKNLSCWADAIVARVFEQQALVELAKYASVPVINALSDNFHPCQALADFLTLAEHFDDLSQVKLAYVGDANNVAYSLMLLAAIAGTDFTLVHPQGYGFSAEQINHAQSLAAQSGSHLQISTEITTIGKQDVLYTDTWVSMGDSTDVHSIESVFLPYQVNHQLVQQTGAQFVMHCQPAHLEQEITTELFDSDCNLAFEQAENRMWAQNAVLTDLLTNNQN